MVSLDKYTTQYTMLNAPKDTGKRMRAYLSILLAPPVEAAGWAPDAGLASVFCIFSNFGARRWWREPEPEPVSVLDDESSGTVGVEGGAGGVVLEDEAAVGALAWVKELGWSRVWPETLPVELELEDNWLVWSSLDMVIELLLQDSFLWLPLGSGWDWVVEFTRLRRLPLVSEFCCGRNKKTWCLADCNQEI